MYYSSEKIQGQTKSGTVLVLPEEEWDVPLETVWELDQDDWGVPIRTPRPEWALPEDEWDAPDTIRVDIHALKYALEVADDSRESDLDYVEED